jgi:hypothetical protein
VRKREKDIDICHIKYLRQIKAKEHEKEEIITLINFKHA